MEGPKGGVDMEWWFGGDAAPYSEDRGVDGNPNLKCTSRF